MHTTSLFTGILCLSIGACVMMGFLYWIMLALHIFKRHPIDALAEGFFKGNGTFARLKAFGVFFVIVFLNTVLAENVMQYAVNGYVMGVFFSFLLFFWIYPVLLLGVLKENFWYKELALFWFFIISHCIYWWMIVAFYVTTLKDVPSHFTFHGVQL